MNANKNKIIEFILDSVVFDETKGILKVSISHFITRNVERENLRI